MKKLLLSLIFITSFLSSFAQFSTDDVKIYVKAGDNPAYSNSVYVIGYYSNTDKIRNMTSTGVKVRKTMSSHREYFESPYNIPETTNCLSQSYRIVKYCQYKSSASNGKYSVYSGSRKGGYDWSGCYNSPATINFAFSKDGQQMLVWESGKENQRKTYLLTSLTDFDPSTSSSSNYDFLE